MQRVSGSFNVSRCRQSVIPAIILCVAFGLLGCTDLHEHGYAGSIPNSDASPTNPGPELPLYRVEDLSGRVQSFLADGYVVVAVAAFVTSDEGKEREKAVQFGADNNADVVIMWDVPAKESFMDIPSGLPPQFCRFAGSRCGSISIARANRAHVYVAMARRPNADTT